MSSKIIQSARIARLNENDVRSDRPYVLYWMQQSQRAHYNHALEYAVQQANDHAKPLLVGFGLMDDYPEANARHYMFLLQGLKDVASDLARRNIGFTVRKGHPAEVATELSGQACLAVCDRGYTRHQKQWRRQLASAADCPVVQVESDVVVPVDTVSDKAEYAARTIRPKIHRHLDEFLRPLATTAVDQYWATNLLPSGGLDVSDPGALLGELKVDHSVAPVDGLYNGGTHCARVELDRFFEQHFEGYDEHRNQCQTDYVSNLSMYLHFGQISPVYVAWRARYEEKAPEQDKESFLEELIVRRELSQNFVNFCEDYDSFECLPEWARKTLSEHKDDIREHVYSKAELEAGDTHDPAWNAAMCEMRETGYMHNYMRMYWGKKIIQWTNTPKFAYKVALELNNRYFLDGRDPNSFGNVAWLFGLHDRAWQEREVFGKIRYMSAAGLKRKFDVQDYIDKVHQRVANLQCDNT